MPRRARVALRGGDARLRHRHHHVGVDRRLAGQLLAHALARRVHAAAVEHRVGTREVDELEQAQLRVGLGEAAASARPTRRSRASRRARPRARSARRRCRARRSRSRAPSRSSSRPSTSGQMPCGSRTPMRCASSIITNEKPPSRRGQHALERDARGRGRRSAAPQATRAAMSSATSAESVVESRRLSAGEHARQHPELLGELRGVREVAVVPEREAGVADLAVDGLRVAPACSTRWWSSARARWRGGRRAARGCARRTPA